MEIKPEQVDCDHLWVRRRDGSWCAYCGLCRFGVMLNDDELEKLRKIRAERELQE